MRKYLANLKPNSRHNYTGTIRRFGVRHVKGKKIETIMLSNVRDPKGNFVTNHIWVDKTEDMKGMKLNPGDSIEFNAKVSLYIKGHFRNWKYDIYKPLGFDFGLYNLLNVKKI